MCGSSGRGGDRLRGRGGAARGVCGNQTNVRACAARGQGVGRQILAFLEEQLCLRQIGLARLETGIDSPEALRLYASMGYERTPPFAGYSEDPLSVFYAKELVGPAGPPQTQPQEE